jgi:hypothetical protein
MELPPDELDEVLPEDWKFPAAQLYRWLALGRRVDQMLAREPPLTVGTPQWQVGWNACLDAVRDGFVRTEIDGVPTREAALRLLRDLCDELNAQRGLTTRTLGANLRLVAQLLADEIERRDPGR